MVGWTVGAREVKVSGHFGAGDVLKGIDGGGAFGEDRLMDEEGGREGKNSKDHVGVALITVKVRLSLSLGSTTTPPGILSTWTESLGLGAEQLAG